MKAGLAYIYHRLDSVAAGDVSMSGFAEECKKIAA
jgi:hypothetical protein